MGEVSYANKLKTQLYWWLARRRPFYLNDEYKIELLFIDSKNGSAKIQITNLKTGAVLTQEQGEAKVAQAPDKLQLIFERWKASLRDRDRSAEHVVGNFDELFDDLSKAGVSFNEAYTILPSAIKAHQPAPGLIRSYWKLTKSRTKNFELSEKEFAEKWCGDIADMATNSFYNSFPMQETKSSSEDGYAAGKISEKEYRLMRKHADQFKSLDLNSLPDPNEELMTDEEEILRFIKERMK